METTENTLNPLVTASADLMLAAIDFVAMMRDGNTAMKRAAAQRLTSEALLYSAIATAPASQEETE